MDFKPEIKLLQRRDNVWTVEEGMVRCFLIVGREKALLFDAGAEKIDLLALVRQVTSLPITLVLSHSDGDHTAAMGQFEQAYIHPGEVERLKARNTDKLPTLLPVEEGDVFDLGGVQLEVLHLPGHTPGSIGLLDRQARILYSGDMVSHGPVFMFGEGRDPAAFIASQERLKTMAAAIEQIYPCHENCPVGPEVIDELLSCMQGILDGSIQGQKPDGMLPPGASPLVYRVGASGIYYDPSEAKEAAK